MDSEVLRARREHRRRALRRRRLAISALLAVLAVVIAIVVSASEPVGSSSASHRPGPPARGARPAQAVGEQAGAASPAPARRRPGDASAPILMYHVIAPAPPGAPFPGLYVPPGEFAAQMQALKGAGWHAVTLDQLAAYWRRGAPLPAGKPIVLSFDNGYQSQYTQALPILRRLGWVADENIQLTGLPPSQGGLGDEQIRGLAAAGWELDTQGFSHADLITLSAGQLHYQVAVARTTIQQRFHVPVNWFCYPSGHYDATVIGAVKAAGYAGSTTVAPGWAHRSDDPYRLHRLRVLGGTTPQGLLEQIASARGAPPSPASYSGA